MEPGTYLEQTGYAAIDRYLSGGGVCDAAQDFQKGRFACSIMPHDTDPVALVNGKANVFQGPELFLLFLPERGFLLFFRKQTIHSFGNDVAQRGGFPNTLVIDDIFLTYIFG